MKQLFAICIFGLSVAAQAQVRYSDRSSGVSFSYPRGYSLKLGALEGDEVGQGDVGMLPMMFGAPGGQRVVTVEAPENAHPGTDFVNAFFTVAIHPYVTPEECSLFPEDVRASRKKLIREIGGIRFRGMEVFDGAMHYQVSGIYYHGYSRGNCIELGYGLAMAGYGAIDGLKQVDAKQVMADLQGILHTAKFAPRAAIRGKKPPRIRSLTMTPVDPAWIRYRVAWDVEGADPQRVWLTFSCIGEAGFEQQSEDGRDENDLPCDVTIPLNSLPHPLILEIRNMTGEDQLEKLRIFAAGYPGAAKTLKVTIPPLPQFKMPTDGSGR